MQILIWNLVWCIFLALIISGLPGRFATKRKTYYLIAFGGIFVLRTFVDPNSLPDLDTYLQIFEFAKNLTWSEVLKGEAIVVSEYGYLIVNKLCLEVSNNYQLLFCSIAIIWAISYHKFFLRYSPYYAVPILLLLVTEFPQSLFVLRQHIAMAIWLFAYPYIISRDLKRFCLVGLLAFSMHMTSVLFFPIYFLYGMSDKKKLVIAILLMIVACVFVFGYLNQLNDSLGLSYDNYITGTKSGLSNMTDFIMRSAYLISFIYIFKGRVFEEGINRLLLVILLFSTILAFFGTSFSLLGRLVRYFTPAVMIMVPIAMKNIRNRVLRFGFFGAILLLNAISIFSGSMSEWIKDFKLLF